MAKTYDDTNRGVLFKNDEKESDKHPDYKGNVNVGGTKYWLSAWLKTSKGGEKYMSLAVKAADGQRRTSKQEVDSDTPF